MICSSIRKFCFSRMVAIATGSTFLKFANEHASSCSNGLAPACWAACITTESAHCWFSSIYWLANSTISSLVKPIMMFHPLPITNLIIEHNGGDYKERRITIFKTNFNVKSRLTSHHQSAGGKVSDISTSILT